MTLLKTSRPKLICLKPKAFIFNLAAVAARYQHAKKVPIQIDITFYQAQKYPKYSNTDRNDLILKW